ncbi:hypothetical protein ACKGJY_10885 [Hyunsoonleella sp. 2307UL5-6]|uniref:hypothetical protein n=1 Tax=Hyunsoonleella sp. 2307UL5-6 TaxID=3384768 RepID=UPI0039BC32E0
MSKDLPQPQQSEEVDLGQLFKIIGNAFDRLFKFIVSIFTGIYKIVLMLLMHFYKRKFWYAGFVILGFSIGYYLDSTSNKLYGANMFIKTNFSSARQVYENVTNLRELATKDRDSVKLASILGITPSEASKLKGFYIEPDLDENDIAEMYSEFYRKLDSVSRVEMNYDRYKESLTPYNYSIHKIGVASTDKNIYRKIERSFTSYISSNDYLFNLLKVSKLNLDQKEKSLVNQVNKTDSLAKEYLKIRINESEKEPVPGAGTNLYMGDSESSGIIVDESKIIDKLLDLESQIIQVNKEKVENQNIVNVIATFPETGYDIKKWTDRMKYTLPIMMLLITLIVFTVFGLGKYLEKESKKAKD